MSCSEGAGLLAGRGLAARCATSTPPGRTALSLAHLASGIRLLTGCSEWESWATAVGIDLNFIALELSMICAMKRTKKQIAKWASPTIAATMAGSALLNALAFGAQTSGWLTGTTNANASLASL